MATPTLPGRIAYGVDAAGALQPLLIEADGSLKSSATLSGDVAAVTEFAEDAAHTTADKGVQVLTVRTDTAAARSGTDGDYQPLITDSTGRLHVANADVTRLTSSALAATGDGKLATTAFLQGGVYNLTKPTISDTNQAPVGLTAKAAVRVALEQSNGTAIDSIGGGTQYAEDAAHTSGDTGTMALAVRVDSAGALAGTTGDYSPLQVDANGALRVTGASGATEFAEDAAHTTGDKGVQMLAVRQDSAAALAGTTGDYIPLSTSAGGALRVAPCKADGTVVEPVADPADGATFTATTTVGSPIQGAFQTTIDHATDGKLANFRTTQHRQFPVALEGADGATMLGTAGTANANVVTVQGIASGTALTVASHAVTNAGTFAVQSDLTKIAGASVAVDNGTAATSLRVTMASDSTGQIKLAAGTALIGAVNGSTAHGAADANNPVKIGGKANAAAPAAVDEGDRADASFDLSGRLRVTNDAAWTPYTFISSATAGNNLVNVKTSAGSVGGWFLQNAHATNTIYFKLYNHAAHAPDPSGDSADCVLNFGLQPKTAANLSFNPGLSFSAGIGFSITTGQATNDETAVGAGDFVVNLFYR
jgi:hypothetical protein